MKVTVVVREPGKNNPDYSLPFDLPFAPEIGHYISIQRPDNPEPYGEDMIVRRVWWRLNHPETGIVASEPLKSGTVGELTVECEPAIGPYSSDRWRDQLENYRKHGRNIEDMDLARVSIRQDAFSKSGSQS